MSLSLEPPAAPAGSWRDVCRRLEQADEALRVALTRPTGGEALATLQRRLDHGPLQPAAAASGRTYPSRGSQTAHRRTCPAVHTPRTRPPLPHWEGRLAAEVRVPWRSLQTPTRPVNYTTLSKGVLRQSEH
eukprot:TRINITY_DN18990_c0_g1_i1.p2 TRINITY_DN18990_c0_g1~~TRINITY_DN18990_c0_g1_i1.p2  ORF type:complete len:131 (+),score=21.77 TRINITY_DN18990_c0_g1_i1:47-439(+)